MKKFVQYLYEYQNEKRVQNLGFVRVEESKDSAVIQIYGKGFPAAENQTLEIFLFYMKEGKCIGIPVTQIKGRRPMVSYHLEISPADVGGEDRFHALCGVILKNKINNLQKFYAAIWGENAANIESMMPEEMVESESEPEPEEPMILEEAEEACVEPEAIVPEASMEQQPEQQLETQSESMPENRNSVYKITRQDLAKLPRQEWKLANNHFLMHGCRNFHHLVSFEKDGACWLGVPGIYHPQEERAAHAFGFEQFMIPDEGDLTLTEEEQADQGDFGYWCRVVSNVIRR